MNKEHPEIMENYRIVNQMILLLIMISLPHQD